MSVNIPIYRAKKINSDEYIEGYLGQDYDLDCTIDFYNNEMFFESYKIDPSTLAIHFPDMLDSEGNKIFASLSEDGKGGDVLNIHQFVLELGQNLGVQESEKEFECSAVFTKEGMCFKVNNCIEPYYSYSGLHEESFKVIGIQE